MISKLQEIGLSQGEIAIYEALLELGESTKTNLAKKSGVSPSNIYDITNRLLEKGLISRVEKNKVAHFSAANPNQLQKYLEQKKAKVTEQENLLKELMPNLLSQYNSHQEPNKVEQFEGWKGLQTIFDDLLEECEKGDENFVFGANVGENEKQTDIIMLKNSRAREEKGIKTRIVFNEEVKKQKERIYFFIKSNSYDIKFSKSTTPTEIMLYKNKVCIIMLEKKPLVIRITNDRAFASFKTYFDIIWNSAS